jgi:ceramide glucosyltransferase
MKFFLIPVILLVIQSVWSLRAGSRFLALIRKARARPCGDYAPPVGLIIPCKGPDEDLRRNAGHFLSQDYPRYQAIFAVASERDPAYKHLAQVLGPEHQEAARWARKQDIVIAGCSDDNGDKVHNLLAGLNIVDPEVEVLAFADIDGQPETTWLRSLVAPLEDPRITVSTGYRWYLPSASLGSRLRTAWDSSIATMMGEHDRNFAWGGSMAMRRLDFERLQIADDYWQGTVSDDYAVTRAVRDASGKIHFEPRCLVASEGDCSLPEFIKWTNRQIIITRIYAPHYWRMGLASYSLYGVTFLWGLTLLILPRIPPASKITAVASLAGILALGTIKGAMRGVAAERMFPCKRTLERYRSCYWRLAPIIPWVMLYNFVTAAFVRRIEWSGTVYEVKSRNRVRVVRRE